MRKEGNEGRKERRAERRKKEEKYLVTFPCIFLKSTYINSSFYHIK
jgi:hypothetical protein